MKPLADSSDKHAFSEVLVGLMAGLAAKAPCGASVAVLPARGGARQPTPELAEEVLRAEAFAFYKIFSAYARMTQKAETQPSSDQMVFLLDGMAWIGLGRTRMRLTADAVTKIWGRGQLALRSLPSSMEAGEPLSTFYAREALNAALFRFRRHLERHGVTPPDDFEVWFRRPGAEGSLWFSKTWRQFSAALDRDPKLSREWTVSRDSRRRAAGGSV